MSGPRRTLSYDHLSEMGNTVTTVWRKVQGDVKDTIIPVLSGIEDLGTVDTVESYAWRLGTARSTLETTVLDADARTLLVQLGGVSGWLSTAEDGIWNVEYQLTFIDGTILTWPSATPDQIIVRLDA